jgi:hypothetical protein
MTRGRRTGSTLLETLIAVAIMAMTAALLSSYLGGYGLAVQRSTSVTSELNRALDRRDFRTLLEASFALVDLGTTQITPFRGDKNRLEFGSYDAATQDLVKVVVSIDEENGVDAQVTGIGQSNLGQSRLLILGGKGTLGEIAYFGNTVQNGGQLWSDSWSSDVLLPRLVRLTFFGERADIPLLTVWPAKTYSQREMSLSSLLPP